MCGKLHRLKIMTSTPSVLLLETGPIHIPPAFRLMWCCVVCNVALTCCIKVTSSLNTPKLFWRQYLTFVQVLRCTVVCWSYTPHTQGAKLISTQKCGVTKIYIKTKDREQADKKSDHNSRKLNQKDSWEFYKMCVVGMAQCPRQLWVLSCTKSECKKRTHTTTVHCKFSIFQKLISQTCIVGWVA